MTLMLKSTPSGYDMSPFIRRYAKYLSEKSTAYRFVFSIRALVYSYTGIPKSVLLTKSCLKAICVLFQITSIIEMVHGYICSKLPKEFRKVFGELYNCFLGTLYFHALVTFFISKVYSEILKVILTTETETFTT